MRKQAKMATMLVCLALFLVAGAAAQGQEETAPAEAPDTVAGIVESMPAENASTRNALCEALLDMGPEAVSEVCAMLKPPAEGGDANARFALNGLTVYAGRPGASEAQRMLEETYAGCLETASGKEVKAFLMRQLQVIGTVKSVPVLAPYLGDDRLCEPATQALLGINVPAASQALAQAYPDASGPRRITLAKAVGEYRNGSVMDTLMTDATSEDQTLRLTALYALANIGGPAARNTLAAATGAADAYEKAKVTSYYVLFARRLDEAGHEDSCVAVCGELLAKEAPNVQCAALSALIDARGQDALDEMLARADSESKELRDGVLLLADRVPGRSATRGWCRKAGEVSPVARAEVLAMLGRRGDRAAFKTLAAGLQDEDAGVRLAAIDALVTLNGAKAVPELVGFLKSERSEEEAAAVRQALLRVPTGAPVDKLIASLGAVPPANRPILLEVLAQRRVSRALEAVHAQAASGDDAVRQAAIEALARVAGPAELAALVGYIVNAPNAEEEAIAQRTVVTVAKDENDPAKRAAPVLAAFEKAEPAKKAALLKILPEIGGEPALEATRASVESGDEQVRDAAIRALADWPEPNAAPHLLELAKKLKDTKHHVLVLRGYIRLASGPSWNGADKVTMVKHALATARRADEKQQALGVLGDVRTIESLRTVLPYLADDATRGEAVSAAIKAALPRDDKDKGMTGGDIAEVLWQVYDAADNDDTRHRIQVHLASMGHPDPEGFVPLFNGKDLTGWVGDTQGYVAEDGKLICKPGGNLYTAQDYGDFILRFEFKLPPGGNNGLAVRAPEGGNAYNGMELQILDNSAEKYKDLKPYQYHGSVYGIAPAKRGFQKPVGEWNQQTVIARGRRIEVVLNGTTIVDVNLDEVSQPETMDGREHKNLDLEAGRIGFLGHGDVVEFRNIWLKELD